MPPYVNDSSKNPEQAMFDLEMANTTVPLIFPPGAKDMIPAFRIHMMEYSVTGGNPAKSKAIYLPLPSNGLVDNYEIGFNTQELGAVIGGIASTVYNTATGGGGILDSLVGGAKAVAYGIGKSLAEGVGDLVGVGDKAGAAYQSRVGTVYNPNYAILFEGIKPRSFQFRWMLTAVSESDVKAIQEIVYILKKTSLPTKNTGEANFLLNYPYIAYIGLFGPDKTDSITNKSIFMSFATGGTFIEGLSINYNGGAATPAFFKNNNAPVQVELTLSFRERNILTSTDIRSTPV